MTLPKLKLFSVSVLSYGGSLYPIVQATHTHTHLFESLEVYDQYLWGGPKHESLHHLLLAVTSWAVPCVPTPELLCRRVQLWGDKQKTVLPYPMNSHKKAHIA